MPSTARVSCQATCGFSGLPKLRQLVRPSGSAPTQARFAAHSQTASAAPMYGSQATRRPLPSIETASARPVSLPASRELAARRRRPARAAAPCGCRRGSRTARTPSGGWRRSAEPSSAQKRLARRRRRAAARRGRGERAASGRAGSLRLEVVERALVDERRTGMSPTSSSPSKTRRRGAVGDLADRGRVRLPLAADGQHVVEPRRLDDAQHPLLRLGDHDLERLHVRLAQRAPCETSRSMPDAALRGHLARAGGEARRRRGPGARRAGPARPARGSTRSACSPRAGRRSARSAAWRGRPRRARRRRARSRRRSRRGPVRAPEQHDARCRARWPRSAQPVRAARGRRTSRSRGSSARRAARSRSRRRRSATPTELP